MINAVGIYNINQLILFSPIQFLNLIFSTKKDSRPNSTKSSLKSIFESEEEEGDDISTNEDDDVIKVKGRKIYENQNIVKSSEQVQGVNATQLLHVPPIVQILSPAASEEHLPGANCSKNEANSKDPQRITCGSAESSLIEHIATLKLQVK